ERSRLAGRADVGSGRQPGQDRHDGDRCGDAGGPHQETLAVPEEQACAQLLEEASIYAAERAVAMQADIRAGHPAQEIVRAAQDQGAIPPKRSCGPPKTKAST